MKRCINCCQIYIERLIYVIAMLMLMHGKKGLNGDGRRLRWFLVPLLPKPLDRASGYNAQFEQPLPANEVRHTAKSIARWTHQHLSPAGFSAWQAEQGAKGGRIGGKVSKGGGRPSKAADLLPEILRLKALGYTNRDIADDLQISAGSVSNYLRRDRA